MRIVSLLPSATEIVCLLGAGDRLVAVSHECDHPPGLDLPELTAPRTDAREPSAIDRQVREALRAGETLYTLNDEMLRKLRPDLILTQDLCSVCSIDLARVQRIVRELADSGLPVPRVLSLNPQTIEDVFDDILRVGRAIGCEDRARREVVALRDRLWRLQEYVNPYLDGPSVALLEWTDPLFCAGHWTVQMIERAGGRHLLNPTRDPLEGTGAGLQAGQRRAGPSRQVTIDEFVRTRPEIVVVAPCGLDLDRARTELARLGARSWFADLPAARSARLFAVDGNQMFNRPGPRLVDAFAFLVAIINDRPELIPDAFPYGTPDEPRTPAQGEA